MVQTKKEISASIPRVDYENELAQYIPQRKRLSRRKELPPRDSFFEDGQEILDETSPNQPNPVKRPKRQIEFSPTAGHFQFVSRILELICTSGSTILDVYGTVWLPYHLKKVTLAHLNLEDYEKKKHIGYYMFKYLFDQKIVKKCMTLEALQQIRMLCYNWPTFLTEGVIEWLQDAAVRSGAQHYVEEVQDHKLNLPDFIDELDPVGPLILPFKNCDHILLALMRKVVASNHDGDTKADHNSMLEWIWDFYEGLDNTGRADGTPAHPNSIKNRRQLCRNLLRHYSKDKRLVSKALSLLKEGNHETIYYKLLSQNIHIEYDAPSVLTTLLQRYSSNVLFHERFCQACRSDPVFIQKAYAEARIHDGDDLETSTHIRYYYGVVLFAQGKVDEAVLLWKENVPYEEFYSITAATPDQGVELKDSVTKQVLGKTSMDQEDERRRLLDCQIKTAERLASAYIGLARKVREKEVKEKYVRKIQKMQDWMVSNVLAVPEVGPSPGLTVLHGRVMKVIGHEKGAVDCLRPLITHALRMLYDEETENDWEAYLMLAQAFTPLEDDKNALAAWALLDPVDEDDEHHTVFPCADGCGFIWKGCASRDMHICRDCVNVQFRQGCLERLFSGALDGRVCRKDHQFLKVPKWTRKAGAMKDWGRVDVGGTPMLINDWLNDVRLQYGISRSDVRLPKWRVDAIRDVNCRLRKGVKSLGGDSSRGENLKLWKKVMAQQKGDTAEKPQGKEQEEHIG